MARKKKFLYGKNSVLERLKINPGSIRQVFIQDNFKNNEIVKKVKSEKIPVKTVSERDLLKIKRADRLQGIVAEIDDFKYTPFDDMLKKGIAIRHQPGHETLQVTANFRIGVFTQHQGRAGMVNKDQADARADRRPFQAAGNLIGNEITAASARAEIETSLIHHTI